MKFVCPACRKPLPSGGRVPHHEITVTAASDMSAAALESGASQETRQCSGVGQVAKRMQSVDVTVTVCVQVPENTVPPGQNAPDERALKQAFLAELVRRKDKLNFDVEYDEVEDE